MCMSAWSSMDKMRLMQSSHCPLKQTTRCSVFPSDLNVLHLYAANEGHAIKEKMSLRVSSSPSVLSVFLLSDRPHFAFSPLQLCLFYSLLFFLSNCGYATGNVCVCARTPWVSLIAGVHCSHHCCTDTDLTSTHMPSVTWSFTTARAPYRTLSLSLSSAGI